MDYLARKITRGKWARAAEGMQPDAIRADAITACLRTSNDTLSVWECQDTLIDASQAILALAAAGNQVDKLDVVLLNKGELAAVGVATESTPENARTVVADLAQRHVDIVSVEMSRLSAISSLIASRVRSDAQCYQLTRKQVATLIYDAVASGRIDKNALDAKLVSEVEKLLQKSMP